MTETVKLPSVGSPEKRKPSFFWLLALIMLPVWSLLVKYRFAPGSKLPSSGPFILSPNHVSELDPIAMGVAVWHRGRLPRFLAKASLFRVPVLRVFLRVSGQIPVERDGQAGDKNAPLRAANEIITKQGGVIVYPEGTLTRDPHLWPMRGKSGAVRLALEGNIPLIPAAHWGVQKILPRYGKLNIWGRKQVMVAIGEPLDLSAYRGKPITKELLAAATDELMEEITRLLARLRQEEPPATRWNPKAHNQNETGRF